MRGSVRQRYVHELRLGAAMKKIVLVDFDGTLNSYHTGFEPKHPEHLPDGPNPGAIAWLRSLIASQTVEPVIFSTRLLHEESSDDSVGRVNHAVETAIRKWLAEHGLDDASALSLRMTCVKIKCSLIVDDHCYRYEGRFPPLTELNKLTGGRR